MVIQVPQVDVLVFALLPGAAGGLASFLAGLKAQHYKNNKYIVKFGIEVIGGAMTASWLVYVLRENQYVYVFSFLIGTAWSQILQKIRTKVTRIIEAALGESTKN
jgi:hypothetical protein